MDWLRSSAFAAFASLAIGACDGAATGKASAQKDAAGAVSAEGSVIRANDMVLGSPDAKVTIVEYASVTCPACAAFHENFLPEIKEKYIDTGLVNLVFREFPTPPADFSLIGSVLARCAAEKGGTDAYFLVLGSLFSTQRAWIYGEDPKLELLKIAAQAGMDEPAFDACLRRQEFVDLVNRNVAEASEKYSVNSTPTLLLNGKRMSLRSAEEFSKALDEALEKAGA